MNEFELYLNYLSDFINTVDRNDPTSPFLYPEWLLCGRPTKHIPGLRFEDNSFLQIFDDDGNSAWLKLDERMANTIAEGISTGGFTISSVRPESTENDSGS